LNAYWGGEWLEKEKRGFVEPDNAWPAYLADSLEICGKKRILWITQSREEPVSRE
jgi:hypothetical protein